MQLRKTIIITIFCSATIACSSNNKQSAIPDTVTESPQTQAKTMIPVDNPDVGSAPPLWFLQPELAEHITAIGTAPVQKLGGRQAQYLAAMQDAHQRLEVAFTQHKKNQPTSRPVVEQEKTLLLHHAIIKDEWFDPESGELYLWLALPLQ